MTDKLDLYRSGAAALPATYQLWPLYGAGLENLGRGGRPIEALAPAYGPEELLVRHDACGLCFSDVKVIAQGQSHPRIFRDMQKEPVVLGHGSPKIKIVDNRGIDFLFQKPSSCGIGSQCDRIIVLHTSLPAAEGG